MMNHPVGFHVEPSRMEPIHVVIRLALLAAFSAVGCSSLYWLLFLVVPAIVALLVSQKGSARYLAEDAPGIVGALVWLARAYAYLWLLTDRFPTLKDDSPVDVDIETGGAPTPGSALLRVVYSLPALVLAAILSLAAGILWVIGAIAVLFTRRLPAWVGDFLAMTLRFDLRLAAYHLSIVAAYPSLDAPALPHAPPSGAA